MLRKKILLILVLFCFNRIHGLKECNDCFFISSCENAKALEHKINDPDIYGMFTNALCGLNSGRPQICCSDFNNIDKNGDVGDRFNDVDKDEIENHHNIALLPDDCGPLDITSGSRIIGGKKAHLYEYPWMALLSFENKGTKHKDFACGGTIINSKYILTAAHCFDDMNKKLVGVRVGEYEIGAKIDCQLNGVNYICENHIQDLPKEKVIVHEHYNKKNKFVNDIALIRTKSPIDFNYKNVKPICLPKWKQLRNKNLGEKKVKVAGWGRITNKSYKRSKILQTVEIPVWKETDCINSQGISDPESLKILCAGEKGRDSCEGDSGGPLMAVDEYSDMNRMVQFGIVSYGPRTCGTDEPGVYTDLTKYVYWILENIKE